MKTALMGHVVDTQFELQCKMVAELKGSFAFLLERTSNCVTAAGFTGPKATWSGLRRIK